MTRWLLAPEAADDLERLADFLLETDAERAIETIDLILDALAILEHHPRMGRPCHRVCANRSFRAANPDIWRFTAMTKLPIWR